MRFKPPSRNPYWTLRLAPALALTALPWTQAGEEVEFERDVRPLLESRCIECHGPKRQKALLRLDRREAAFSGAYGGEVPVILPGDAAHSPLFLRVADRVDGEDRMPPKGEPLSGEEVDLIERWIDAGAVWPSEGEPDDANDLSTHWAYRAPRRTPPPTVRDGAWPRDPLDHFVLARLEAEDLAPSTEADRATLLRRASLDLTGLPPTPAELDAFLGDTRPDAFERAVERLLTSPAWAEHMTREWLDLARYADTNGYEKDERRTAWRWRDWVLDAFQRDLPFDRFTRLQLAGDLLPDASLEDRIATGFHRNTMVNSEGGTDPEEFRVAAAIDRVNTTASVWLGSTLSCAQCHNHKYDPFSQREYFGLYAFFDSTEDTGNALAPQIDAPLPGQAEALDALEARVRDLEAELDAAEADARVAQAEWESGARALVLAPPDLHHLAAAELETASGAALDIIASTNVLLATGTDPDTDTYTLEFASLNRGGAELLGLRLEVLRDEEDAELNGPGRAEHGNFVLTDIELRAGTGRWSEPLAVASARASFEQTGFPVALALDDDPRSGWAVNADGEQVDSPDRKGAQAAEALFTLAETLRLGPGERVQVTLRFDSPYARHTLGRFRITWIGSERGEAWAALPPRVRSALAQPADQRTRAQGDAVAAHHARQVWPAGRALVEALAEASKERDELLERIPTALVMRELETPRDTRVLERGSHLAPGDPVTPYVPAVLHPWPEGAPPNRLGLAHWLTDPANPLTARVVVNRTWGRLFGRGIVATVEDFGTRGEAPSHPELLDALAVDFVEQGWSLRALQRRIVTSATYRQSSRVTANQLERDPENRLLARAPRLRLEAEVVRDAALASAGLLERTLGGPSVFPPQPDGIWASTYSGDRWTLSEGSDRWRRGMYTFHKRTSPYPSFTVFDGTSRELACTRRPRSNTPLQALVLLNDPVFVEAAIGLARRTLSEAEAEDRARVRYAFRLVTGREPSTAESDVLLDLLAAELERYRADPESARRLIQAAQFQAAQVEPLESAPQHAAWAVVANALLNTDEFVTRD